LRQVLHPVNPFWKFWGVKGLLSVNFLQSTVLALVSWMTANDATGFVATLLLLGSISDLSPRASLAEIF
jgi:hypothetical protein